MSKKEVVKRMILGNDAYTSKTLIKKFGGYTPDIAEEIFQRCKDIDMDFIDLDLRPGYVRKSTFFKVTGINLSQEIRRIKASEKLYEKNSKGEENEKSCNILR